MAFVRTVLGDIAPEQLGVCYAHEHVILAPSFATHEHPDFLHDDTVAVTEELRAFHAAGGRAMIDALPCATGRDVLRLAEVSRASGVHLVGATGLHLPKYYPPGHWRDGYGEDELSSLFLADLVEGVDARDYGGPLVRRTPHRAGVIKLATGADGVTDAERPAWRAAAEAHRASGAPILTHTEGGAGAFEQVEFLRAEGVDLAHVCLSHTDRQADPAWHRELLASGVNLEYDGGFRWKGAGPNPTVELLARLLPEFPDQLMLGMDAARRGYWTSFGGAPGHVFLLGPFSARLRAVGIDEDLLHRVFVATPARVFAFAPRN